MKRATRNILFYTLTSFTAMSFFNFSYADDAMTVPTLPGGMIVSVGTFYAIGSADNQDYVTSIDVVTNSAGGTAATAYSPVNNNGEYDFGFEASLGYIFNNTANGIELSYRGLNSSSDDFTSDGLLAIHQDNAPAVNNVLDADNDLDYEYNDADLLVTQYLNLGRRLQARLAAGIAYFDIEQTQETTYHASQSAVTGKTAEPTAITRVTQKNTSRYNGLGPRLGVDARYDLGRGFGFLGGLSTAFFLGSLDVTTTFSTAVSSGKSLANTQETVTTTQEDDRDNQNVFNASGNLAFDYVYPVKSMRRASVGIELGYRVDYYDNAVGDIGQTGGGAGAFGALDASGGPGITAVRGGNDYLVDFYAVAFSGPYLDIKAAF